MHFLRSFFRFHLYGIASIYTRKSKMTANLLAIRLLAECSEAFPDDFCRVPRGMAEDFAQPGNNSLS